MTKPAVSRDAFRGLFAFYAAKAHHEYKQDGERCLLTLFGSAEDIPDNLLLQWSDRAELIGSESVGSVFESRARQLATGETHYDHASDFLHRLLRDLAREVQ